ncbi:MAG TPA: type II toxin-antitoxin system prevent-host-death family antitoxin [Vicinamibacterales bacterium]
MVRSTRYGYDRHIGGSVRSTNIADLRNRLTQYLREVRAGEEIVVRDRQRPIAKIVPLSVDEDEDGESTLVASGLMRKAERPLPASFWKGRRGRLTLRKAVDALSKDREER